MVLSEAGIPDSFESTNGVRASNDFPDCSEDRAFASLHATVEDAERLHIRRGLARTNGSVSRTAELLGISRKTLWEKMKRLQIAND